jgi:hypothetical protein
MKKTLFIALLAIASFVVPASAQHLNFMDTSTGTINYFNLIPAANSLCTALNTPYSQCTAAGVPYPQCTGAGTPVVPYCTGNGTGTLTSFPSGLTLTNLPAAGSSGAWTGSFSLAGIPAGTYVTQDQACISATSTSTGGCATSVPFCFNIVPLPNIPTQTLGP